MALDLSCAPQRVETFAAVAADSGRLGRCSRRRRWRLECFSSDERCHQRHH